MNSIRSIFLLRIAAIVYAVFLLVVSTGATLSIHYCNGNIIDIAVDGKADVCEGFKPNVEIPSLGYTISKKGCCEDDERLLVFENDYPPTHVSVDSYQTSFTNFVGQERLDLTKIDSQCEECLANPPPLIRTDYQVLFQVFLI
jgi:hypothetical protein